MKCIAPVPFIAAAVIAGATMAPSAAAAAAAQPLAVVGGDTLTTVNLDGELSATLSQAKGGALPAVDPDGVLKRLVQNRLLEQEGYRIGADQSPDVKNQVREFIRLKSVRALLDLITARVAKVKVDPDSLLGQAGTLRRYSHILVKDQATAAALRDSLRRGVSFGDLARRHSIDGTAAQGGDLGWQGEGAYVDAFESAAAKLSRNEVAGPVQTRFGWHLITLTGVKADTVKSRAMAEALIQTRQQERDRATTDRYVDSLRTSLHVTVNDSLVHSLDYGSKDPAVEKNLATSEAVLAVLPTGKYTVRSLTRNIHFKYFHGITGRPEAAQIRDKIFDDWVTEGLLTYQARQLRLDRDPVLLAKANMEERRLVREQVLQNIFATEYKPTDREIQAYYQAHQKDFIPAPRVKVFSVLVKDSATATRMRGEMDAGAALKFLASRSPAGIDSLPPFPTGWIDPGILGVKDAAIKEGTAIGPMDTPAGSALGQITAVERPGPEPLKDCREDVIRAAKGEHYRQEIVSALARLEAATPIKLLPGARETVAARMQRLEASRTEEMAHE